MLVMATIAFSEFVRMFFLNLKWRVVRDGSEIGPDGNMGFAEIRFFSDRYEITKKRTIYGGG